MTRRLRHAAKVRISEGVRIDGLPLRDRLLIYVAYPRRALGYFHLRLRQWATLPGDTWYDLCADRWMVITAVKPAYVEAEVYSGQFWSAPGAMRMAERAPRVRIGSIFESRTYDELVVEVVRFDRAAMGLWAPA